MKSILFPYISVQVSIFLFLNFVFKFYVHYFFACIYVCIIFSVYTPGLLMPETRSGSSGTGDTDGQVLPYRGWDLLFLTAEPPFQWPWQLFLIFKTGRVSLRKPLSQQSLKILQQFVMSSSCSVYHRYWQLLLKHWEELKKEVPLHYFCVLFKYYVFTH